MFRKVAQKGGKVQKAVNKAASKAGQIVKRSAKKQAPVRTGTLKKNIVIRSERSQYRGKKVRQVTFKGGEEANAQLQKKIKQPGALGGKSQKAYYPASIEYGFLARAPGGGVQYIEGLHYMREGADLVNRQTQEATVDTMMKELEKLWTETSK